ncbi:MAG TPA: hypothetical protein VMS38_13180 [Pseudorhodoferax sp.]|nr:hypothetical protein [Pseudorhodoferax sp.]
MGTIIDEIRAHRDRKPQLAAFAVRHARMAPNGIVLVVRTGIDVHAHSYANAASGLARLQEGRVRAQARPIPFGLTSQKALHLTTLQARDRVACRPAPGRHPYHRVAQSTTTAQLRRLKTLVEGRHESESAGPVLCALGSRIFCGFRKRTASAPFDTMAAMCRPQWSS